MSRAGKVWLVVAAAIVAAAFWPILCIAPHADSTLQYVPPLSFARSSSLDGASIWRVPRIVYLFTRLSRREAATLTQLAEPRELRFEPIKISDLPPRLSAVAKAVETRSTSVGASAAFLRLVGSRHALSTLRDLDVSAGRFVLRLASDNAVLFERTPSSSLVGEMKSWTSIDKEGNTLQVTISDSNHAAQFVYNTLSHSLDIRSLDDDPEYYSIIVDASILSNSSSEQSAVNSSVAQDARAVGVGSCGCYCPGVGVDHAPWPTEDQHGMLCGEEGAHCYKSGAKLEHDVASPIFRVAVVASPRTSSLRTDPSYGASVSYLESLFRNSFKQVELEVGALQVLLNSDAPETSDQSIWIRTGQYSKSTDASWLDSLHDDAQTVVSSLRQIRNDSRSHVVVYIVPAPYDPPEAAGPTFVDVRTCGQASAIGRDDQHFFAVVAQSCLGDSAVLAHEIGHLLGGRHEIYDDVSAPHLDHAYDWTVAQSAMQDWMVTGLRALFPRAQFPRKAWTMGDAMASGGHRRIPYFSEVDATCDGVYIGRSHASARKAILKSISTPVPPPAPSTVVCRALSDEAKPRSVAAASIYFDVGSDKPFKGRLAKSNQIVLSSFLKDIRPDAIGVLGFSDTRGAAAANVSLAYARSKAVDDEIKATAMNAIGRVPASVICAYGAFNNRILGDLPDEDRWRMQRRVELIPLNFDFSPVSGEPH